ncbi:transposase [Bacteroides sp. 519]|uniref:transposase n=1 Tax=Bacteroides sp. 519 TaxID=2302937 RepID=UPI0013D35508|nr:transposase [Bacteroides sp. 519]
METSEKKGLAKGLEKGREEGLAEGLEKGLAKGREEGILEIARKMKSNSIPLHTIQELTGLSPKKIEIKPLIGVLRAKCDKITSFY